jgi:hypothetical protein
MYTIRREVVGTGQNQLKGQQGTGVNVTDLWGIRCINVNTTEEAQKNDILSFWYF